MKILLINPPRVLGYPVVREERFEHKDMGSVYPPLSLLQTASLLEKAGYEVNIIDANGFDLKPLDIGKKIKEFKPEVTLVRIGFDTQKEDLKTIKLAKEKGCITLVRNHIISRTPVLKKKLLRENKFVDYFLNQEPEAVILPLLKAIKDKKGIAKVPGISYREELKVIDNPSASLLYDLNKLPFPAYHLLPRLDVYYTGSFGPPFGTILGSRGCPFNCAFCAYGNMPYRIRSPKSIAEEIAWFNKKYHISQFCFLDDVVTINPARMIAISKAIIAKKLNLRWSVGIRATSVTYEMLTWMKKAGCDEIAIGIESGSDEILKTIDKRVTVDDIKKAAEAAHKAGIKLYAMFIIGLPGETRETVEQSIRLAKSLKPFYTQFCFATPFPDTRIYTYYKKNGLLVTEDWSKYFPLNREPIIRTKELTRKDLIELKNKAYRETLFDLRYLISQVKLNDWKWNIRGIKELGKRMAAALSLKPVR